MSPAPDERERIRGGIDRLLNDQAKFSNGALTIVALAQESQVPRNALTQRHTGLKNEFYELVKARGATQDVPALVRTVHILTLENQDLREQLSQPHTNVVAFRPHPDDRDQ